MAERFEQPLIQQYNNQAAAFTSKIPYVDQPGPSSRFYPSRTFGPAHPIGGPVAIPGIDGLNHGHIAYRDRQTNYHLNAAQRQQQRAAALQNELRFQLGMFNAIHLLHLQEHKE